MKRLLSLFAVLSLAADARAEEVFSNNFEPMVPSAHQAGYTSGPGLQNPGNPGASDLNTTVVAPTASGSKVITLPPPKAAAKQEAKEKEKMDPSKLADAAKGAGGGEGGGKDSGGGGGGGCSKGCQVLAKDNADLKTAVSKLNGSDDPALKKLGQSLEPYSVTEQEAKAAIDRATLEMKKAKAAADDAASQLKTFADANKKDTEKIKKFAEDAEKKGTAAEQCDTAKPGKAEAPTGETSRSTKLPSGVEQKVKEARTAADAAQKAADELKAKAAQLQGDSKGKIGEISLMQAKLGTIAQSNKQLQALVQRAADNANQQYTDNVAPTLKEVQEKVKALEEAMAAAKKADPSAQKASETATQVKTAMEGASKTVAAGKPAWDAAPASAKMAACTPINPAVSDHKSQASKPKTPAETADKDADDAKSKAATAAGKKIREV